MHHTVGSCQIAQGLVNLSWQTSCHVRVYEVFQDMFAELDAKHQIMQQHKEMLGYLDSRHHVMRDLYIIRITCKLPKNANLYKGFRLAPDANLYQGCKFATDAKLQRMIARNQIMQDHFQAYNERLTTMYARYQDHIRSYAC